MRLHPRPLASLLLFLIVLLAAARAQEPAGLALDPPFGARMVLPRDAVVTLSGSTEASAEVEVRASWQSEPQTLRADDEGRFEVALATVGAGGPHRLLVRSSGRELILEDLLLGDVWLASGQSNMEWPLSASSDAEAEIAAADHPGIRFLTVPNRTAALPRGDLDAAWTVCRPEVAGAFSGVAYFFAREVHRRTGVPIGIVAADWGGTPIEAWMDERALRRHGGYEDALTEIEDLRRSVPPGREGLRLRLRRWRLEVEALAPGSLSAPPWQAPDLDDADWEPRAMPALLAGDEAWESFDGFFWLRARFRLEDLAGIASARLELGGIDDQDLTWINGVEVGATEEPGFWNRARAYEVPLAALRKGENVLAIRGFDTGGAAGLNGRPEQHRLVLKTKDGAERVLPLAGTWRARRGLPLAKTPRQPTPALIGPGRPTALWNGMVAPLARLAFPVKGFLWYQGESNAAQPERYATLLPEMIRSWRAAFGGAPRPFLIVQIAPFEYGDRLNSAALRDAQRLALRLPSTGLAVTLDLGDARDIHPRNKRDVGLRLALLALRESYGLSELVASGPLYRTLVIEGPEVRVLFDETGSGLELRGDAKGAFELAGADRIFHPAEARVFGGTELLLRSAAVPRPAAVRYAWKNVPAAPLFNREGLPASSFRSDSW